MEMPLRSIIHGTVSVSPTRSKAYTIVCASARPRAQQRAAAVPRSRGLSAAESAPTVPHQAARPQTEEHQA